MVDSVAATSLVGYRPLSRGVSVKNGPCRRKAFVSFGFGVKEFAGVRVCSSRVLPRLRSDRLKSVSVKAIAAEVAEETYAFRENKRTKRAWDYLDDDDDDDIADKKPGLWPPKNRADDPSLHNPLFRQERMGCGWLAAVFEMEGVLVEDNPELETQAWVALAQEEGIPAPPAFMLRRIEGMKSEQAISEVFCWSREPSEMKRMAARKEEIHQALQGSVYTLRSGSHEFVNVLMHCKIPMALVSTRPRERLENAIGNIGIKGYFNVIVAAEDAHRGKPDPEMFIVASQLLNYIPERCIVFGNSNQTVEAAHDIQMKCVAVASKHPVYELGAADLIVNYLDELSIVDLKNLADIDSPEFGSPEPELEPEEKQEEEDYRSTAVGADDIY